MSLNEKATAVTTPSLADETPAPTSTEQTDVPGSFPEEKSYEPEKVNQDISSIISSAGETAKQYVPSSVIGAVTGLFGGGAAASTTTDTSAEAKNTPELYPPTSTDASTTGTSLVDTAKDQAGAAYDSAKPYADSAATNTKEAATTGAGAVASGVAAAETYVPGAAGAGVIASGIAAAAGYLTGSGTAASGTAPTVTTSEDPAAIVGDAQPVIDGKTNETSLADAPPSEDKPAAIVGDSALLEGQNLNDPSSKAPAEDSFVANAGSGDATATTGSASYVDSAKAQAGAAYESAKPYADSAATTTKEYAAAGAGLVAAGAAATVSYIPGLKSSETAATSGTTGASEDPAAIVGDAQPAIDGQNTETSLAANPPAEDKPAAIVGDSNLLDGENLDKAKDADTAPAVPASTGVESSQPPAEGSTKPDPSQTQGEFKRGDDGYDEGYHPAELHPLGEASVDKATSPNTDSAAPAATTTAADGEEGEELVEEEVDDGQGGKKKVSFFKKLKGQAKIVSGKISSSDEKVEEGKKIIAGQI